MFLYRTSLFALLPPSALPSDQKKFSRLYPSVRPPPSDLGPILYSGANPKFALKCIGLTPGPRSDVRRRTGAMSGEVFYGRSVSRRGVGRRRALSDGGRRMDGSFDFSFEPPFKKEYWELGKTGNKGNTTDCLAFLKDGYHIVFVWSQYDGANIGQ